MNHKYQLFGKLRKEEFDALEKDILKRGIQVAIERDTSGNLLDGHHRMEIAEKHGLEYEEVVRDFGSEEEKKEHVIMLNLARRHLEPWQWGQGFKQLLNVKGVKRGQGSSAAKKHSQSETISDLAASVGVDERTARNRMAQADLVESLPKKQQTAILQRQKTLTQVKREQKELQREKKRQQDTKRVAKSDIRELKGVFSTIVIDPPWSWADEKDVNQLGRAKPDYATMTIDKLLAFPLGEKAAKDSHLYCWVTNRSMPKVFALLETWGFRYITLLTWPKPSFGMGTYFRGQTEHVAFGVRGSLSLKTKSASTLLPAWKRGRRKHSSKPSEFYEFVESCSPGPYLEVFARSQRANWVSWNGEQ